MPPPAAKVHTRRVMAHARREDGLETIVSSAHSASAQCLARAITSAFDACDEAEIHLSQRQRIAIIEAALLEFDGFDVHLLSLVVVGRLLDSLDGARGV